MRVMAVKIGVRPSCAALFEGLKDSIAIPLCSAGEEARILD